MTLADFMGLEHPFRFCDCIPLNGSTSVAAPNVVHSTGESSRPKIVQSAVEALADSSEAERRDLVRAEMHREFLFSGVNPGRKKCSNQRMAIWPLFGRKTQRKRFKFAAFKIAIRRAIHPNETFQGFHFHLLRRKL